MAESRDSAIIYMELIMNRRIPGNDTDKRSSPVIDVRKLNPWLGPYNPAPRSRIQLADGTGRMPAVPGAVLERAAQDAAQERRDAAAPVLALNHWEDDGGTRAKRVASLVDGEAANHRKL